MGLELDQIAANGFNIRCDDCGRFRLLGVGHHKTAAVKLRALGWHRTDYIETAHHYCWSCPTCKGTVH